MTFDDPTAPGDGITWGDHNGALLLINVLSFEPEINTTFGTSSAVRADVDVIDGTGAGASYQDTLIFPKLLVSQTKSAIGKKVLARLGQGEAKPGQSAPWLLNAATDQDKALAQKWTTENASTQSTQPAPPF